MYPSINYDLLSKNILIDEWQSTVKLTGFENAIFTPSEQVSEEVLDNNQSQFASPPMIFCFGIIMYELFFELVTEDLSVPSIPNMVYTHSEKRYISLMKTCWNEETNAFSVILNNISNIVQDMQAARTIFSEILALNYQDITIRSNEQAVI